MDRELKNQYPLTSATHQILVESHFSDSDSAPASGFKSPAPTMKKLAIITSDRLLFTPRKFPRTSYQKDSVRFASCGKINSVVIFSLIQRKWLKWSHEKHNAKRHVEV